MGSSSKPFVVVANFSQTAPSLISLRSGIFDYEFENGRTYHSMSRGSMSMDDDATNRFTNES